LDRCFPQRSSFIYRICLELKKGLILVRGPVAKQRVYFFVEKKRLLYLLSCQCCLHLSFGVLYKMIFLNLMNDSHQLCRLTLFNALFKLNAFHWLQGDIDGVTGGNWGWWCRDAAMQLCIMRFASQRMLLMHTDCHCLRALARCHGRQMFYHFSSITLLFRDNESLSRDIGLQNRRVFRQISAHCWGTSSDSSFLNTVNFVLAFSTSGRKAESDQSWPNLTVVKPNFA